LVMGLTQIDKNSSCIYSPNRPNPQKFSTLSPKQRSRRFFAPPL
jgi:hypothetical protein